MRCLIDSCKEISNKSEEPFQTCKAHTGIILLITGLILAVLGSVATALIVTGILSMLPSFVMFVFPSVALLGLIIVGVGTGLLMQRYRLKQAELHEQAKIEEQAELHEQAKIEEQAELHKQAELHEQAKIEEQAERAEINALFEQALSLIKNMEDKIAQESKPKHFLPVLDNLNRLKFTTKNLFNAYNRGFHCYWLIKADIQSNLISLQSVKKFYEEKSLSLVKMLDQQNAERIADQKAQIIRDQQEAAQSSEKVESKWVPKIFK